MKKIENYLQTENITKLIELSQQGTFTPSLSYRRRMGENGMNNPSMYHVWKWDKMNREQRSVIKDIIGEDIISKTVIGYFLKLEKDGLIDRISTWKDYKLGVKMFSIALKDNQRIWIDDQKITLNAGDAIEFQIQSTHCIPKTDKEDLWLCLMVVSDLPV